MAIIRPRTPSTGGDSTPVAIAHRFGVDLSQELDSYPQEINRWVQKVAPDYLIIQERDNEIAPETAKRFAGYVEKEPEKVHVGPYLTNIHFGIDGTPLLFWGHRIQREQVMRYTIEEVFNKLVPAKNLPLHLNEEEKKLVDLNRSITMTVRYPAWVAGGEKEADICSIGYTYLPKSFWDRIYPEIKNVPWNILDVEVSARLMREGLKPQLHWDCVVNHAHIDISQREKSVFRKWIGHDHTPLTREEKAWLKVDELPPFHGWIGEPAKPFPEQMPIACPRCSATNTWQNLVRDKGKCAFCGELVDYTYPKGMVADK